MVGAIEGLAEGAASVTKVAAGRLADRFSRRPLIGAGHGLAALGKLLIALATVWPRVLVARVVDRLGKGMRCTTIPVSFQPRVAYSRAKPRRTSALRVASSVLVNREILPDLRVGLEGSSGCRRIL
ncbi:hypothetical protein [Streptomyces cellostaticus]|uniref:hypothetical protein n=1 Tax=Streptomyces cellostaticus TaxID=67285 RepID=UPI002025EDF6|nr:hypothetical protein [Streptomyces cellostaticus]